MKCKFPTVIIYSKTHCTLDISILFCVRYLLLIYSQTSLNVVMRYLRYYLFNPHVQYIHRSNVRWKFYLIWVPDKDVPDFSVNQQGLVLWFLGRGHQESWKILIKIFLLQRKFCSYSPVTQTAQPATQQP